MKNQQIDRWFGISLTKKRTYYLLVFSIIGFGFFTLLMFNALEILLDTPNIYEYDVSIYYKVLLLGFSNLIMSLGFIGICGYTLRKIRLFRKSLKIQ
ncbi:MAG: hypothetical protein ACTSPN_03780 [Promethearchaeota archaeon]